MGKLTKRQHTANFKVQVALEAIKQTKTLAQIASEYQVHPTQIRRWKEKVETGLLHVFNNEDHLYQLKQKDELINELYRHVGKLQLQLGWLKKKMGFIDESY